jgi:hypothetical protein
MIERNRTYPQTSIYPHPNIPYSQIPMHWIKALDKGRDIGVLNVGEWIF